MDEYVGLAPTHPASFQRYMRERVVTHLPFGAFYYIAGAARDPDVEAARYAVSRGAPGRSLLPGYRRERASRVQRPTVADFDDPLVVKVVELDERCKLQQVGEGHFATLTDVPTRAITVTVPGLLRARDALAIVPEARKASQYAPRSRVRWTRIARPRSCAVNRTPLSTSIPGRHHC